MVKPLIRFLCLPDIQKPIGGVKQLYRQVEHLCDLGFDAAVVTETSSFRPSWFQTSAPTVSLKCAYELNQLNSSTILVVPETYIGVNFQSFHGIDLSVCYRVIFNQNAYYSFGSTSVDHKTVLDFYFSPKVLHVLSVSEDTHDFLLNNVGISDDQMSRVVNAIEPAFVPSPDKTNTIHWMPRKNSNHSLSIINSLQLSPPPFSKGWNAEPLDNISHDIVSNKLNVARIFLSFGHPEGFGLPVAEAMASGCWVIGYSGGGAKELFRLGLSDEIPFGDWSSFYLAVNNALKHFELYPRETNFRLQRLSLAVRSLYSPGQELSSIKHAWSLIEQKFLNLSNSH